MLLKQDFFKKLPSLFNELDLYTVANQRTASFRNISFEPSTGDSLSILTGVNTDRLIQGDVFFDGMRLPMGTVLAIAHYEGEFRNKGAVYKAVEKYLSDHKLFKGAAPYEKYLSSLPVSDSSIIKIDLCYPLRTSAAL